MKILSEKEYIEFYEKTNKCIDESFPRKNPISHKALLTRYKKYLKRQNAVSKKPIKRSSFKTKAPKEDVQWNAVRKNVQFRDKTCRLFAELDQERIYMIKHVAYGIHNILDPAHVFGKGPFPHMKYDEDNVVLLNRYSHSMLDSGKDPIHGKTISKEDQLEWWKFIVGNERFERLLAKSIRRNNG